MANCNVCSALHAFFPMLFPMLPENEQSLHPMFALYLMGIVFYLTHINQPKHQSTVHCKIFWCLSIVSIITAINIMLLHFLFDHYIPIYYEIYAAICWSLPFWLNNFVIFFLMNKSHGKFAIKKSFIISIIILALNIILFTIESYTSNTQTKQYLLLSTIVYMTQCLISIIVLCVIFYESYPHHFIILWIYIMIYFCSCLLKFLYNTSFENRYKYFCFVTLSDYIQHIILPVIIIILIKKDSNYWTSITKQILMSNREYIQNVLYSHEYMDNNHTVSHQRVQQWVELLSQNIIMLNPSQIVRLHEKPIIGACANIIKAKHKNECIAIKEWKFGKFNNKIVALWCKEILILSTLNHKNIVKLKGILTEESNIKMVMEWCQYDCLHNMLLYNSIDLPWNLRYLFLYEIAIGVNYLHKYGFIYRDLKSLNVLVDKSKNNENNSPYTIKLCDFGSTAMINGNSSNRSNILSTAVGTIPYLAPEILKNIEYKKCESSSNNECKLTVKNSKSVYGKSADVYSYGIIIWEIITRKLIYEGLSQKDIIKFVVEQNGKPVIPQKDLMDCSYVELLKQLMNKCVKNNSTDRPSFDQIINILLSHQGTFLSVTHSTSDNVSAAAE
eukprot:367882_1